MILLIGGEKGGTGKSTLATNLAVWHARAGRDVLVVDTDQPQWSAANWVNARAEDDELPQIYCAQRTGNIVNAIKDLRERYGEIIIDCGGRDSIELRSAMTVADKMYTPLIPSQWDMDTADRLAELLELARGFNPELELTILLSKTPTNPVITERKEALEYLRQFKTLRVSTNLISDRKAYRDGVKTSRGVLELENEKARAEILSIAEEIYGVSQEAGLTAVAR